MWFGQFRLRPPARIPQRLSQLVDIRHNRQRFRHKGMGDGFVHEAALQIDDKKRRRRRVHIGEGVQASAPRRDVAFHPVGNIDLVHVRPML